MKDSEIIFRFVLLALAAVALLLVLGFAVLMTQDAIATTLQQRFESAPPEGFDYWYHVEVLRNLKDLAIPAIIWLGLFILVIRGLIRAAKR